MTNETFARASEINWILRDKKRELELHEKYFGDIDFSKSFGVKVYSDDMFAKDNLPMFRVDAYGLKDLIEEGKQILIKEIEELENEFKSL